MATNRYLTQTEEKLIEFLKKGFANKTIAREMEVSENTVKYHLKKIYKKLKVHNRMEAVYKINQSNLTF